MKKFFISMGVLALSAGFAVHSFAQDDFSKGNNYYLIYLDSETEGTLLQSGATVKADLRPDDVGRALYIWEDTYIGSDGAGKNWNGSFEGYLNFSVSAPQGWSGLGFCIIKGSGYEADLTGVDDSYTMHIAMKSSSDNSHLIILNGPGGLAGRICVGSNAFVDDNISYAPFTNFTRDNKWHLVEIPMSAFFNVGLRYPEPITDGNYWSLLSGNAVGTNIAMDAIFIYKKNDGQGIGNVSADNKLDVIVTNSTVSVPGATEPLEVYNLMGKLVKVSEEAVFGTDELEKGAYIVRSGHCVAKIVIK